MGQNHSVLKKSKNHNKDSLIDYSKTKSKWEINMEQMVMIGKYFKTNQEYVNVMKVSKKYEKLVE